MPPKLYARHLIRYDIRNQISSARLLHYGVVFAGFSSCIRKYSQLFQARFVETFATSSQARDFCIMESHSLGFLRVFAIIRNNFWTRFVGSFATSSQARYICIMESHLQDFLCVFAGWGLLGLGSHVISSGVALEHHPWFLIIQTPYRLPDWLLWTSH